MNGTAEKYHYFIQWMGNPEFSSTISYILIVIVFLACGYCYRIAQENARKGVLTNHAQYAISIGVLGTFLGILVGLLYFKTGNAETIAQSINSFIDGMRLAFVTSIMGMITSLIIKRMQSKIEKEQTDSQANANNNSNRIADSLESIQNTTVNMSAKFDANTDALTKVISELTNVAFLIREGSSAVLGKSVSALADEVKNMSASIETSMVKTEHMAQVMEDQNTKITELKQGLLENSSRQSGIMETMGSNIAAMKAINENSYGLFNDLLNKNTDFHEAMLYSAHKQEAALVDNNNGLTAMRQSFDAFLDKVAENFSKRFIEALTESIQQLNCELQEQLGGNFQKLNQAVTDLLEWQINYKDIIEKTQSELKCSQENMETFLQSAATFENHVKDTMPDILSKMHERLHEFDMPLAELQNTLSGVGTSLHKFDEDMQSGLREYAAQLGDSLSDFNTEMSEQMKNTAETSMSNINNIFEEYNGALNQRMDDANQRLNALFTDSVTYLTENVQADVSKAFDVFHKNLGRIIETIGTDIIQNVSEILEAQKNEIVANYNENSDKLVASLLSNVENSFDKMDANINTSIEATMEAMQTDFEALQKQAMENQQAAVADLGKALLAIQNKFVSNYEELMKRLQELNKVLLSSGVRR